MIVEVCFLVALDSAAPDLLYELSSKDERQAKKRVWLVKTKHTSGRRASPNDQAIAQRRVFPCINSVIA